MKRSPLAHVVATIGLLVPVLTHAACKLAPLEMPVTLVDWRATATVRINGSVVPLTVDSGAFYSTLTDAAAEQLKLKAEPDAWLRVEGFTGEIDVRTTIVDKVQLLKGELPSVEFIVGGNEPGAGTMGLMGRNILAFTDAEYDLAHGVVRIVFPNDDCGDANMAYWAGSTPVTEIALLDRYGTKAPAIRARVKLNGQEFTALFDTGAPSSIVSLRAARRLGITDLKPAGVLYGAGRGRVDSWSAPFESFELGGERIANDRLLVADFESGKDDVVLGLDFFLAHRIYVSKRRSRMFVTYNGGTVFALNRGHAARTEPEKVDPAVAQAKAETADAMARRGAASAARGDYAGALVDLNEALAREPASAAYLAQRAAIQWNLGHAAEELKDFDRALDLDPAQDEARFGRARLRARADDRDGAQADLDALDRALAPQSPMRLALARQYLALDRPAQAIVQVDQWLAARPHEATRDAALNTRCWARVKLGAGLDQALRDCDEALDIDAKNWRYLDSRGWVHLRMANDRKAVADFDRSIEYHPQNASALYGRGIVRKRLGDAAAGEADLAAARKIEPDIDQRWASAGFAQAPSQPGT